MESGSLTRSTPRRLVLPVLTLAGCIAGIGALLPPAVAASTAVPGASERPSVALDGTLDTAGLPGSPTVSLLTVRNTGAVPVQWTVRGRVDGTGSAGSRIEVLAAVDGSCAAAGAALVGWSPSALAPGSTDVVCVRISVTGSRAGVVTPTVTVDARPA